MSGLVGILKDFRFFIKNNSKIVFCLFFFLFFTFALSVTFFNDSITELYDIIFGADCPRVYNDFVLVSGNHYRTSVHPLQLILIQPIISLLSGLTHSPRVSLLILNSIVTSLNVLFINLILFNFTRKWIISILGALIYGVSFSSIVFSSIPETYMYAVFFSLVLFYYISEIYKNKFQLTFENYLIISILTVFAFGIIPVCIIPAFILIFWLFNKLYKQDKKLLCKNLSKVFCIVIVLFLLLMGFQKLAYPKSRIIFEGIKNETHYLSRGTVINRTNCITKNILVHSFYSLDIAKHEDEIHPKGILVVAKNQNSLKYIFSFMYFIFPLIYFLTRQRKYKCLNVIVPLSCISLILLYSMYIYGGNECFLYSQNVLPYIVILMTLLYSKIKNSLATIILSIFIIFQLVNNVDKMREIISFVEFCSGKHHSLIICGLYSLGVLAIICAIVYVLKRVINKNLFKNSVFDKFRLGVEFYSILVFIVGLMTALFHGRL